MVVVLIDQRSKCVILAQSLILNAGVFICQPPDSLELLGQRNKREAQTRKHHMHTSHRDIKHNMVLVASKSSVNHSDNQNMVIMGCEGCVH